MKCNFVKNELGFDECIDYKSPDFEDALTSSCDNGVDIYFENVGGITTQLVAPLLNKGARVPICGYISKYNSPNIIEEEWMDEWDAVTNELSKLVLEDKLRFKETITEGFENAPQGLRDVLSGKNFGKQLIKI
jgi:NADPH-dependent curcumin reductase CurA